jgi:8-oxo-dGTP pyrophosphatase MutT (NUDIX family)
MDPLFRHIAACNNVRLPGERLAFRLGAAQVGWVLPAFAEALRQFRDITFDAGGVTLANGAALDGIVQALAQSGKLRWRGEAFDVRAAPDGPVLARIDRGALPKFGICAVGVHVNGLVRRPNGLHVWVGRRAANKLLDPGKLDHLIAGGVAAGHTLMETLVKEAAEEAAVPAALAATAAEVGRIGYAMTREEGLRRDILHCYDLYLSPTFMPYPADGEVAAFELWPIERVLAEARAGDAFKFNVNLVLIDLFLRHGLIAGEAARDLRAALDRGAAF